MSDKTFATLAVASAATGIGMSDGLNYSLIQQIYDHVLGRPVWTHELADKATNTRVHELIHHQLPNLPSREEAQADWRAAAAKATEAYGETVTLARGNDERTESPVDSLARMTGKPENIIVISGAKP